MDFEKYSLKTRLIFGICSGLFFATGMAVFDYFNYEPFSLPQFIFYMFFFGLFMALAFKYKVKKE